MKLAFIVFGMQNCQPNGEGVEAIGLRDMCRELAGLT